MSRRSQRRVDVPSYVLQTTAWRETSLIARVLTRDYGVIPMVAKGAKRPYSGLRAVLMPFQPLTVSWSGAAEVKTLTHAEVCYVRAVPGSALMSCWYMNELLLRLLASEDPHPGLFDAYAHALDALILGQPAATALRAFEWATLRETGYGFDGELPSLENPRQANDLRIELQQRLLEHVPGGRLNSREVMASLRRLLEPLHAQPALNHARDSKAG
jgi:DNA repair protein RecO (recombination protein O)